LGRLQFEMIYKFGILNNESFFFRVKSSIRFDDMLSLNVDIKQHSHKLFWHEKPSMFLSYKGRGLYIKRQYKHLYAGIKFKSRHFGIKYLIKANDFRDRQLKLSLLLHSSNKNKT
jgi:hypothetical protein